MVQNARNKVLVIGNIDIIAKSIHHLCGIMDVTCVAKVNGVSTLKLLFSVQFDIIVASVFIEDLDAVQLIPAIKYSNALIVQPTLFYLPVVII